VRPSTVVVGMAAIGHIHWLRWSSQANGRGEARVPNGPSGTVFIYSATIHAYSDQGGRYTRLRWTLGGGSDRYIEWDRLIRSGGVYAWRVVRYTGSS